MFKLFIYEMKKLMKSKIIMLGILLVSEIFFLIGLSAHDDIQTWGINDSQGFELSSALLSIGLGGLVISSIIMSVVATFEGVFNLYRELTRKEGYLLFMTPFSSYQILFTKFWAGFVNLSIVGCSILALAIADIMMVIVKVGGFELLRRGVQEFILAIMVRLGIADWLVVGALMFCVVCQFVFNMASGTIAVIVGHLAKLEKGFLRGLVTFIVYVVISNIGSVIIYIAQFTMFGNQEDNIMGITGAAKIVVGNNIVNIENFGGFFFVVGVIYAVMGLVIYMLAATILDKRLDV